MVECAKIFSNGGSQAVRLPKACRFDESEVFVQKIGSIVLLSPKDDHWESMWRSLDLFTDDFMDERNDELPMEKRESL